jgi:single-strand DNA-binding protein
MASLNKVMLIGNLTRDPELRALPSGINVADLRLAVNETYTDKSGQKTEKTCFVDVVMWDKQADLCKSYLSKGSPILIEGRLQMDEWTTKEGEKRSKLRVRADRFQFLGAKRGGAEGSPATNGQARPMQGRSPASSPREDTGTPEELGEPGPADGDSPF